MTPTIPFWEEHATSKSGALLIACGLRVPQAEIAILDVQAQEFGKDQFYLFDLRAGGPIWSSG